MPGFADVALAMADPKFPFEGLAWPWVVLFTACLVVVVGMFLWTLLLFVRGHTRSSTRPSRRRRAPTPSPGSSSSRR